MTENQDSLLDNKKVGGLVLLTGLFHLFMTVILRAHVPTEDAAWQWFWAFISATPLTGTFFLASSMFSMVLIDQLRRKNSSKPG